ncbi:MAG TPA: hypothetical protein VM328_01955 [Fimbriimonadaceae bacterium]|nr:hypothetical protein [Fimbriimonadaceae bacterium]
MNAVDAAQVSSGEIVRDLRAFLEQASRHGNEAVKPGHRIPFHWPPHPISHKFHVLASDWTGRATFEAHGETFDVAVARTPHGVFGRCLQLWHEARGVDQDEMLTFLKAEAEPLFRRQFAIAETLGLEGRYQGSIQDLSPSELVKLLYCSDRDVAAEAKTEIEKHASLGVFCPALIEILNDDRHPMRRSAQWCVLDLFEDLPRFCAGDADEARCIDAMRNLIWNAKDDYARTVYKAGVVLGGHLPDEHGGPVLLECLDAPSKYGRRSAIHGLFHVVEWHPEMRPRVVAALRAAAEKEADSQLRDFAAAMADDIEAEHYDHIPEPVFSEEA